jgi:hypothetical protein
MERYEYMRLPLAILPQEIIDAYKLDDIALNGNVYVEIRRGMYGLPQAGITVNQLLTKRLHPHGYYQCRHTPGLCRHLWRPILFSLVVNNFGISYVGKQHADHLIHAIENDYVRVRVLYMPSKMTMTSPRTGQEHSTVGSPSRGTTSNAQQDYPCQATSRQHYINTCTPNPYNHNIHLTNIMQSIMEHNNNYQHLKTKHNQHQNHRKTHPANHRHITVLCQSS